MWNLIIIALRYMAQRKLRTALTTLAIIFGVAVIFGSNTMLPSIEKSMEARGKPPGTPDIRIIKRSNEAFDPENALTAIRKMDGIDAVTVSFHRNVQIPVGDSNELIELVGFEPETAEQVARFPIKEGRFLQAGDERVIVIPSSRADQAELTVGDEIELASPDGVQAYTIVGLLQDNGAANTPWIIPLADMQSIFRSPESVTAINVSLLPDTDQEAVTQIVLDEIGRSYQSAELTGSNLLAFASLNFYGVMALFVGGFLIVNTFRTLVAERRFDFAMLRAIGAEQEQVITLVVTESLIQGVVGTALGIIIGYGFAAFLMGFLSTLGNTSIITGEMKLYFNLPAMLASIALGVLTTLVAGYLPARAAGKVSPMAALRPEEVESSSRSALWTRILGAALLIGGIGLLMAGEQTVIAGSLLFLFGMIMLAPMLISPTIRLITPLLRLILPQEADIIAGNVLRQPKRAAVLVNALTVGFSVVIASLVLTGSMGDFFVRLFGGAYRGDMLITPSDNRTAGFSTLGAGQALHEALLELDEVEAVAGTRITAVVYDDQILTVIGLDADHLGTLSPLYLKEGEFAAAIDALGSERAAVVNVPMAKALKLEVGDTLEIETPEEGPRDYRVVGIGDDNAIPANQYGIMISHANIAQDFGIEESVFLTVDLREGVASDDALPAVERVLEDYPQFKAQDTSEYRKSGLEGANAAASFFNVMAVVVIIPSLLGLFNTLLINVTERRREIGMLRAIGGDRSQVLRMIAAEAVMLAALGSLVGAGAGIALGMGFVSLWASAASTVFGGLYPVIPMVSIAVAMLIGLVTTWLVSLFPARNAARLDIVQVLRYE